MQLNADFAKRASVHAAGIPWVTSPMPGVERKMLDRIGNEVARATTIVRYAAGSHFSSHVHTGGEEFLVLEGVFQDEHGDYPKGSYLRNPPQSYHTPGSKEGCTILVKLWQFDPDDRKGVRLLSDSLEWKYSPLSKSVRYQHLHEDIREKVCMERWEANSQIVVSNDGGAEMLVVEGGFRESNESFVKYSWLRIPIDYEARIVTSDMGATVWIKTGHLRHITDMPN